MQIVLVFGLIVCVYGSDAHDVFNLRLVQILFRHGARSPTHAYPTDPYQEDAWAQGFGQLTKGGKEEMFQVGRYIKSRYVDTGYLTAKYTQTEIHIQSTDKDRALMSAYLVLAGLYPPDADQQFNPSLPWQPIPVHTVPLQQDFLLALNCPSYEYLHKEFMSSPDVLQIQEEHQDLINYVSKYSGLKATLTDFIEVLDPVYCEVKNNKTLPQWLQKDDTADTILQLMDLKAQLRFSRPNLARIKGGPLLGRMLVNMKDRISDQMATRKAFLYSGHDTTINAFLNTLQAFNHLYIPTGSCVFVELHTENTIPVVYIYFRNNTQREPYLLQIPGCPSPCPLSQLETLTQAMVPEDPKSTCLGIGVHHHSGVSGTTVGVAVLTGVIIMGILMILGINALRERQRQALYRYSPVNQHM